MQIVEATLPLKMEDIKTFYLNQENVRYIIDYENSALKGKGFLFYVANLNLPIDIVFSKTVKVSEKLELLRDYMSIANICDIATLQFAAAQVLLTKKGVDMTGMFVCPPLAPSQTKRFIKENSELVNNWESFVDSLILFTLCSMTEDLPKNVLVVDDPHIVGNNVVNLFNIPSFFELYFSKGVIVKNIKYYRYQFEEYCYKGGNLYSYFAHENNWLLFSTINALQKIAKRKIDAHTAANPSD